MSVPASAKPAGLSVFFPAYNDSGTIASMVIRAVQAASELTPDYEVIVVNDGSSDATAEIADELARTYPHVRVVHHPKNRGYGGALQTGIPLGDQGADLLHRRRRAVRPGRAGAAVGAASRRTPTSSTATRSAAPIRCIASSSAGCTTTSSACCSG